MTDEQLLKEPDEATRGGKITDDREADLCLDSLGFRPYDAYPF
jgi:hypothetical protein